MFPTRLTVSAMLMFRPLMRYADFSGRASRTEYWLFMTVQTVFYLVCVILAATSLASGPRGFLGMAGWLVLALIGLLVFALPNYALLARRLHDAGLSAFWMGLILPSIATQFAVFNAVGSVAGVHGSAATGALEHAVTSGIAQVGLLSALSWVCSLILLGMTLMAGKRGPNRFGPDPRDPNAKAPGLEAPGEDRWDALIAEAKRGDPDAPYTPVFDFGPGPVTPEPVLHEEIAPFPGQAPPQWSNPAWDPGIAPSRPFGRRTS